MLAGCITAAHIQQNKSTSQRICCRTLKCWKHRPRRYICSKRAGPGRYFIKNTSGWTCSTRKKGVLFSIFWWNWKIFTGKMYRRWLVDNYGCWKCSNHRRITRSKIVIHIIQNWLLIILHNPLWIFLCFVLHLNMLF